MQEFSLDKVRFIPYVRGQFKWMLLEIWQNIEEDGLVEVMFPNSIRTLDEWICFVRDKMFFVGTLENDILGAFWLYNVVPETRAYVAFFFRRKYWKPKLTLEVGKKALNFIKEYFNIPVIVGVTSNPLSVRYGLRLGFQRVGEIPHYFGRGKNATILYKVLEG